MSQAAVVYWSGTGHTEAMAQAVAAAAQAAGEPLDTKPVSMAIDEVYDGRLQVVHKE